jgi:uncharacterized membrane protein
MMKPKKSWWIFFILSLGVMIPFVAPYFSLEPTKSRIPISSATIQFPLLVAHIGAACTALLSGFSQFIDQFRLKIPKVHRYLGRIYIGSVFLSGLLAFGVIFYEKDYTRAMSFLFLDFVWLFTSWKGYRSAVKGKFHEHRKWMIRSFGITLVAVSARVLVPALIFMYFLLHGFALPGGRNIMVEEVLAVNTWVGLVLDLIIVEWMILKSNPR